MFDGLKREVGLVIRLLDEAGTQLEAFETRQAEARSKTAETREALGQELDGLGESVKNVTAGVDQSLAEIRSRTSETRQAVEQDLSEIASQAEETRNNTATTLGDLIDRLSEARNQWDEEIQLGLEALQAGLISFEDFVRRYGDVVIDVEGKRKRLRDILAGSEREIEDRLQNLLRKVRDGATSLEEIIEEVRGLGGRFAETVADMIRKFQEGQITFEELRRRLEQLADQFPDSDFDDLVDDLLDRLQQEERDGLI